VINEFCSVQVSRWLVGIKRLVQEVQSVEAPLSPSSDCQGDVKFSPLCEVEPVSANCPSLIAVDSQLPGAGADTSLDAGTSTDADTVAPDTSPLNTSSADVNSSSVLVTSQVDSELSVTSVGSYELMSDNVCPTFTSRLIITDSDAVKKPDSSPVNTASSSHDEPEPMSVSESTQMPCDDTLTSATSADTVTLNS